MSFKIFCHTGLVENLSKTSNPWKTYCTPWCNKWKHPWIHNIPKLTKQLEAFREQQGVGRKRLSHYLVEPPPPPSPGLCLCNDSIHSEHCDPAKKHAFPWQNFWSQFPHSDALLAEKGCLPMSFFYILFLLFIFVLQSLDGKLRLS